MKDDELDYELKPENAALLTNTLRFILDGAIRVISDIRKNPAPMPPPGVTAKDMHRLIRRMKNGAVDTGGLSPDEEAELIATFERSLDQQRRVNDILAALDEFHGLVRDCDEEHFDEIRDLEKAVTHLAKDAARKEGDDDTVRDINRKRRKAGRSRRK